MVSVELVNKSEYTKAPTECRIRREGAPLKPTPEFSITGMDADKMYQISLSFEQGQNVRKPTHQVELSFPAKPYNEMSVNHPLGINFGNEFMKENIVFKKLRVTNSREHDNTSTIHLNSCHRYTPVLTIFQFEMNESGEWEECRVDPLKFKFEEGSFETVTNYSKPFEKNRKSAKSDSQGPIQDPQEEAYLPLPSGNLKRKMEEQGDMENRRKRPCQRSKEDAEFIATLVQRFSVPELQDILRTMRKRESSLVQGQVQASEDEANALSEAPSIEDQDQVPDASIQLQDSENQSEAEVVVHDDVLEVQVEAEVNVEVEDKDQTLNAADQPETEAPPVQPEPDAESIKTLVQKLSFPEIQTILGILGKPVTTQGQDQVQASEEEFAEASNQTPMLQNPEEAQSSHAVPVSIKIELEDEPEASQDSNQEAYPDQAVLDVEAHLPDSSEGQSEDETTLNLQSALQAIDQPPLTGLALLAHLQAQHQLLAQQGAAHSQFHHQLFHQNNMTDPRFNNQQFQYHQPQSSLYQAQFPPFIPNNLRSEPTQLIYVPMQVPVSHLNQNLMPTNQLFPPQVAYPPPPPPQTSPFYNVLPYNGAPF